MEAKNGVTVSLKTITPEMASKFLESNTQNRKLSQNQVLFYHKQMKSGEWHSTGDTIKFTKDGKLIDGQHRLSAVVKFGHPVNMFVAENLDPDAFDVLDTGKSRTAADILSAGGTEKANHLASIVRFILLFNNGIFSSGWHKHKAPTNHQIHEFVTKNPELIEIVGFVMKIYRDFRYVQVSVLGGLYFLFIKKNQLKADEFFYQYSTGLDLKKTSAVYHLRDKLIRDKMNKTRMTRRDKVAMFIVCWNAFSQGKEVSRLRVSSDEFPTIV